MTFDTHDAANRLKAAGFTEPQVEALVDVARVTTTLPDVSTLATKADLATLGDLERGQAALKSDFAGLKSDFAGLKSDFTGLKSDFTGLRSDFNGLKTDVADLRAEVTDLRAELTGLRGEVMGQGVEFRSLLDARIAGVNAAIATSQLRTITILLGGVGGMLALSRLIH